LTKQAIHASFDAMGLRQSLQANLDLAVQIESLETPSRRTFKEITQREGLKAALAWRDRGGRVAADPT
jgi:enoyl-CoA hydratase